jgi:hypothetical protein
MAYCEVFSRCLLVVTDENHENLGKDKYMLNIYFNCYIMLCFEECISLSPT